MAAGNNTQVVTEANVSRQAEDTPPLKSWVLYSRTPASNGTFVTGPGTPPLGVGSLQLTTPTSADKVTLFNFDYSGTPLGSISGMTYSTYRLAGSDAQVAALNVQVDINGSAPGGFTTLVFEPVYNTNQGILASGQWQSWDGYENGNAIWWSSNAIPGAPNRDTFVTWASIVAANPDAVILGVGINQGSGNPGLITSVDAFRFGVDGNSVTYNFEPYVTAASKDDCKNNGWQSVKRANGSSFTNQGDCVSYVNNGK